MKELNTEQPAFFLKLYSFATYKLCAHVCKLKIIGERCKVKQISYSVLKLRFQLSL